MLGLVGLQVQQRACGVVVFPQGQGLKIEEYGDHCGEQLRRAFVIRTREMERVVRNRRETAYRVGIGIRSGWPREETRHIRRDN